ncbi:MAG: PAS domain S-box protein [Chloroflexi bacterium]|nr:PAS domain S-box protein [Chloroflexota bacterium]
MSSIEHGRQQLRAAQERIAQLEAQLASSTAPSQLDTLSSRYAPVFDDLLEGCQVISYDWRYLYINHAAARFGGQVKEEMIGHTIEERFPGFSESDVYRMLHRCMSERRAEDAEIPFTFPDGRVAWFAFRVQPCPEGIFILTQDITERKRSEEALRSSEERFRRVVETVEDYAIFSMDVDGRIASWNLGAEKITGYAASDVMGKHYAIFFAPEDVRSGVAHSGFNAAQLQGRAETEGWRLRKDGTRFWINGAITTVTDSNGEILGYSAIVRDITDRRRSEEQIHKLNRILAVLSDVNQAIVRVRDLRALFQIVCQIAVEKGDYAAVWIGEVTQVGQRIVPAASAGVAAEALEELDLNSDDAESQYSPTVAAVRTGERVLVSEEMTDGPALVRWQEEIRRLGYRAEAVFPLKVGGKVHAVLTLYASEAAFFDDAEVRLLDEMAGDIAFAMEFAEQEVKRLQGERSLQRYAQRIEILHDIDVGIINAQTVQSIVETTVWNLRRLIPCQQVRVSLFDETATEATIFAVDSEPGSFIQVGNRHPLPSGFLDLFDAGTVRVIDDLQDQVEMRARYKRLLDEGIRSVLYALLKIQGRPAGVIALNAPTPGFFTPEDREIAAQVANQIAIAIRQMQLADALKQHAADLTQRVIERTADLQVAKDHVEAILNNSLDGVVFLDSRLRIVQANTAFGALLGYEVVDPYQIAFPTLVDAGDQIAFRTAMEAVTSAEDGPSHGQFIEVRLVRQDGTLLEVEIGIGRVPAGGAVCTVHDMTARKVYERQLRANARVQDNMSDAVIVTDEQFIIQSWNRAAERIYGWRADEVLGKPTPQILQSSFPTQDAREQSIRTLRDQGWWQGR